MTDIAPDVCTKWADDRYHRMCQAGHRSMGMTEEFSTRIACPVPDCKAPMEAGVEPEPEPESYATYCPDCEATFNEGEEGYDQDECFECGETNCYEINA